MTGQEAASLIREKEGKLCVRFYQRADGTVLTQDCPTGVAAVRRKITRAVAAGIVGVAALLSAVTQWWKTENGNKPVYPAASCLGRTDSPNPFAHTSYRCHTPHASCYGSTGDYGGHSDYSATRIRSRHGGNTTCPYATFAYGQTGFFAR